MTDALLWAFEHGVAIGAVAFALAVPVALLGVAYLWFLQGAKILAAVWVWRRFLHWWRTGRTSPDGPGASPFTIPGGAGGHAYGHSAEYVAFMRSPEWRWQRARVLRRDGHRCRGCGGRRGLEGHHEWYAAPIRDTPDWAITTLCPDCHARAHGR